MNSRDPISRYHLAEVAGLLAEPARAAIMIALLDGSARPATELSRLSGVAAATASAHLHKLCDGKLLSVIKQGRHRYYRLVNEDITHLVESLSLVREPRATSIPKLSNDDAILQARTC
jgi:DNA-binding transcriptional ArsR family regulator